MQSLVTIVSATNSIIYAPSPDTPAGVLTNRPFKACKVYILEHLFCKLHI